MRIPLTIAALALTASMASASTDIPPAERVPTTPSTSLVELAFEQPWPWGTIQSEGGEQEDDVGEAELRGTRPTGGPGADGASWGENQGGQDEDDGDERDNERRNNEGWGAQGHEEQCEDD